jgi:hypothetical protein
MSLSHQIDVYCERTDFSFWSEPINALTNLAFLIAAFFAWKAYKKSGVQDRIAVILIVLMACVGVGSFLFHTFATRWAAMADVIPIAAVIFLYYAATLRYVAGLPWWGIIPAFALIPLVGWVAYAIPVFELLGSTKSYFPALVMLVGFACLYAAQNRTEWRYLAFAAFVFAASMIIRAMDDHICVHFAHGLHWGWHILNATTLYCAAHAYIYRERRGEVRV